MTRPRFASALVVACVVTKRLSSLVMAVQPVQNLPPEVPSKLVNCKRPDTLMPRPHQILLALSVLLFPFSGMAADPADEIALQWSEFPVLPDELGVAGPFAGVCGTGMDVLIVAGGANFPQPVWETSKQWHDRIHVLVSSDGNQIWKDGGALPRPLAYGAAVSTADGVICMGGNDSESTYRDVFRLRWNRTSEQIETEPFPELPAPCAHGAAALIGDVVYLAGGQTAQNLNSAANHFWSLDLSRFGQDDFDWKVLTPVPGPERSLNLTVHQHNGFDDCIYVMSGRRQNGDDTEFLRDVWEYNPISRSWRQRSDVPRSVMAGTALGCGQSHIYVLGGADGSLFTKADELKDDHPGFPKEALAYHTITDTWTSAGEMPANHVTTIAVKWKNSILVPSGEVRPRVRSPKVWQVTPQAVRSEFGTVNYVVLISYLGLMVGVGVWFMKRTNTTDDFFRGGKQIPWWAAGCSIFATMLSSLTYTGLPSKAYAQDLVYLVGNLCIPFVSAITVVFALPFFRQIDATSAYEYLELRFSRTLRLFGSACFSVFHIFRMALVMSLTALALSVATPLSPAQSVVLMGMLSIIYCAMGGIEAVIWTDTIQTVVLLGGAVVALVLLINGVDGGFAAFWSISQESNKLKMVNPDWSITSTHAALWVIVVGGIAQNTASYTADQAVVQRYMTTSDQKRAARAIWTNGLLCIPASLIFFGIGTALFAFYRSHPERLDPTITTDQIFPLFIAREMPVGLAGLIVAGVFAAAQSTVSTSMNSTATAIVVDFLQPLNFCSTDEGYLKVARWLTVVFGVAGTCIGIVFVDPEIKSLFDSFVKVIGVFMGVLGGLFILGGVTTRANALGAGLGALIGVSVMLWLWQNSNISPYIYTACGITSCCVAGYVCSLILPGKPRDLTGLTLHTMVTASDTDTAQQDA